ncbi:MAG: hypothetical protein D6732_26480 [Methanobacteriota archaeon]|nr:MAG: hypothetical protein D6732_26480 [Euryarchaeota archaeon]
MEAVNASRYERIEFAVDVSAPQVELVNATIRSDVRLLFNGTDFDTVEVRADGVAVEFFLKMGGLTEVFVPNVSAKVLEVTFRDRAGNYRRFEFRIPASFNVIGNISAPLLEEKDDKNTEDYYWVYVFTGTLLGLVILVFAVRRTSFKV